MKKGIMFLLLIMVLTIAGCNQNTDVACGEGTTKVDGFCVPVTVDCEEDEELVDGECVLVQEECPDGQIEENGTCVDEPLVCEDGQIEENGACVDEPLVCENGQVEENGTCVDEVVTEIPSWFDGWKMLNEPIGDLALTDLDFTENGFSAYLPVNSRTGIQLTNVVLEPGFYYEVSFDYFGDIAGKGVFVQLQGHSGYQFTNPGLVATETRQTFTQILAFPPESYGTNDGWLTIEITPSGVAGTVTIENIELTKIALPNCLENEELSGIECIPANNGFDPNGTPTAWFDGWDILQIPPGNKEISDLDFTETGYTVYLSDGDRHGIELLNYVFEAGYTYEISFDYTASVEGRLVWVQMEALGGYGFTNTTTFTVNGTATFTESLVIPSSYSITETGWIKLELAPFGQDNVTIDNIVITKTAN